MKNKILFLIIYVLIFIFLVGIVNSAPTKVIEPLPAITLNEETKECGILRPENKFFYYELPAGWKLYNINHITTRKFYQFNTSFGICEYNPYGSQVHAFNYEGYKECCSKFGFELVGNSFLKKEFIDRLAKEFQCTTSFERWQDLLVLDSNNKKCSVIYCINFPWYYKKYEDGLELYRYKFQEISFINTGAGECQFTYNSIFDGEECCKQLGYTFVSKNIGKEVLTGLDKDGITKIDLTLPLILISLLIIFMIILIILKKTKRNRKTKLKK